MQKSLSPINGSLYPYDVWKKEHMFATENDANMFFGELDLLFLLAYAIGLYISGIMGDRLNLRYLLATGMCTSAILTFLFGYLSVVLKIRNPIYFYVIHFLNGLAQSTGWPATVAIVGNWFSKSSGGLVFGFWSGNASLGNIFGSVIVASVLNNGYEYGMLLNSILLFCGGVIVLICLIPHPNMIGIASPDELEVDEKSYESVNRVQGDSGPSYDNHDFEESSRYTDSIEDDLDQPIIDEDKQEVTERKAIGFFQAFMIPGVLAYALAYACLKLVNYAFFFWLPTYLSQGLHWEDRKSDELSNFYDIGGITGGIIAGIITDIMGKRSPIVCFMLLLSMGSLYLYDSVGGSSYINNVAIMVLTGFLIGGPANTISSAISADLGKHKKIQGSADALATVTGIIDGTGSVGAAIGQYLVGLIDKHFGWHYVFYFLIIMTGLSLICILPIFISETCGSCWRVFSCFRCCRCCKCCRPRYANSYGPISDDART